MQFPAEHEQRAAVQAGAQGVLQQALPDAQEPAVCGHDGNAPRKGGPEAGDREHAGAW